MPTEKNDLAVQQPKKRGRRPKAGGAAPAKRKGKPGRKKGSVMVPVLYVQVAGKEYDCGAVMKRVREDYRSRHKTGIHSCKVYIKPEENAIYYVINQVQGNLPLE